MAQRKIIASWYHPEEMTQRVMLTASGRVLHHFPGRGAPVEISHFSERWLGKPDDMIRVLGNTLGPDFNREEKGR